MRAAPPVDAALDAGRRERMLTVLLHALAGVALGAWLALHAELRHIGAWAAVLGASAALLMAVGWQLARRTWPALPGHLRWDGAQWLSVGRGRDLVLARVDVALDLGTWMLLRLHPADGGAPQWRVASARGAGGAWHGLRLALANHAGAPLRADDGGVAR